MIDPDGLIKTAEKLAKRSGKGKPRQSDLRRAISTAYYALFNEICGQCAKQILGANAKDHPCYPLIYRSLNHGPTASVCKKLSDDPIKDLRIQELAGRSAFSDRLQNVAETFTVLQEKRHLCDYDPTTPVSALDTDQQIESAKSAIYDLRHAGPSQRPAFLLLLMFPGPRKN